MTETNVFALAQIIRTANGDPGDTTDAIWAAGYRRPVRAVESEVALALQYTKTLINFDIPPEVWPLTLADVQKGELNEVLEEAMWCDDRTPTQIAMILANQYHYSIREATSD